MSSFFANLSYFKGYQMPLLFSVYFIKAVLADDSNRKPRSKQKINYACCFPLCWSTTFIYYAPIYVLTSIKLLLTSGVIT